MDRKSRRAIISDVRNPPGLFVVALGVIEAAMCVAIAAARLTPGLAFAAPCVMAALFLVVVAAVTITIRLPHHLYEQVGRDLRLAKQMADYTRSQVFRDAIGDIITEMIGDNRADGPQKEQQP